MRDYSDDDETTLPSIIGVALLIGIMFMLSSHPTTSTEALVSVKVNKVEVFRGPGQCVNVYSAGSKTDVIIFDPARNCQYRVGEYVSSDVEVTPVFN